MKLQNEFQPIRDWAANKGIYTFGDPKTQLIKLLEEVGELSSATLNQDINEIADAIGDCVIVLTSIAELNKLKIEWCINGAYDVIAKRNGKMINGTFVKDKK